MFPVTAEYKEKIQETLRVFKMQINVQHSQGEAILTDRDIASGSFIYTESTQPGEDFMPGGVVASHIGFTVMQSEALEGIEWEGATIFPTVALLLADDEPDQFFVGGAPFPAEFPKAEARWEYVPLGRFHVDEATVLRSTIEIKAIDNMIELDKSNSLAIVSYPASLYNIYVAICDAADIPVGTPQSNFPNADYIVGAAPDSSLTLRDVLSALAALAGRFARCTRTGALELAWYEPSGLTITPANRFNFKPKNYQVQITGAQATIDEVTYLAGTNGYVVDLTGNPLLQGEYEQALTTLCDAIKGTAFTPYDAEWQGNPAVQAGDIVTHIDRDGKAYNTLITTSKYKYLGASSLAAKALPPKAKGYKGSTSKRFIEIKQRVDKELGAKLTDLEQAQLHATEMIANMLGGYVHNTEDALYVADHEDLAQAEKVWKWGLGGFGYSSTGIAGPYDTAITADGTIVANLLAAGIITADMLKIGRDTQFAPGYDPSNAVQKATLYNSTKITPTEGIEVFDNVGSRALQIGAIATGSGSTKDAYGFKAFHGDGSFSAMVSGGFIRKYLYGEAKYLNDIWVKTYSFSPGIGGGVPSAVEVVLPQSFKGRKDQVEIFLSFSNLFIVIGNVHMDGLVDNMTSDIQSILEVADSNFNLTNPTLWVNSYFIQRWTDVRYGHSNLVDYGRLGFTIMVVGK